MDVNNGDLNNNNVIEPEILEIKEEVYLEEDKKALNDMFSTIGMSPIKTKDLHDSGKVNLGKRKMSTLVDIVRFKMANIFKLPVESFVENEMKTEIIEKAKIFDQLKDVVISKLLEKSTKSKIQVMTIAPTDWSISKVNNIFPIIEYVAKGTSLY